MSVSPWLEAGNTCAACLLQSPSQQVSRAWTKIANETTDLALPVAGDAIDNMRASQVSSVPQMAVNGAQNCDHE
jgi:hypothetical protein